MQAFDQMQRLSLCLSGGQLRVRRCLVVGALVLSGVLLSWWIARDSAYEAGQRSQAAFRLRAAQIEANVGLVVQRQTDLLHATAAFMQERPYHYTLSFGSWAADVGVLARYPELVSLSVIRPASASPASCPLVTMVGRHLNPELRSRATTDICQNMRTFALTRDSGRLTPFGFAFSSATRLYGESLPVYRTRVIPSTTAGRRQAFLGWAMITVYPRAMLRSAVSGFPDIGLAIRPMAVDRLTFSIGPRFRHAANRTRLANGMSETISGNVQRGSILGDGTALQMLVGGSALSVLVGLVIWLLGTSRERAVRLVAEMTDEIAHQAMHDGLTGLPNRMLLADRTAQALARAERRSAPLAVLFIDVDGFTGVNDSLGHDAGDEVLRTLAARVRSVIRDSDTVGRLGGDEFAVLLEAQASAVQPELISRRILGALSKPIVLQDGSQANVTASIGIARGRADSAEEILRHANLALLAAKDGGKNRYVTFTEEMQSALSGRQTMEFELRNALANGELFLVYQPTFHLDDGTLRGAEALLRWRHPQRGIVSPDQFIPIAEETGLIVEIGRWVAQQACHQAALWQARGIEMVVAVNVSGRQLDEEDFALDIARVLAETGVEPASLVLEVTETALMRDPPAAARRLERLKALGVRIAIDDFGTGYSSLAYLRQLPVDSLKIDRSFISAIGSSQDALALVKTMVQLGKRLRITTLAEGIEDEAQLKRLRRTGCDLGQGFLLARPLRAEQIDGMLDTGTLRTSPVASEIPAWAAHLVRERDRAAGLEPQLDAIT